MSEEEQTFEFKVGNLNKDQLRELAGVIHFLSGMGLFALKECDWEKTKEAIPMLARMSPDHEVHVKMGEVCHEGFSDWMKTLVIDAPPNLKHNIDIEKFYKAVKGEKVD